MKALCLVLFLSAFRMVQAQTFVPDSMLARTIRQCTLFPQEKIYVHTDKPSYVAGEKCG